MSTTKFANVKKSSLVILYSLYSLVLTQAWVLRFGEVGTSCLLTACPMLWPGQIINYILQSVNLSDIFRRGSPEPSPILLSGGYLLTYADTASQFSLELKLKPKSFCQAQPQLNFNPIEAGIVLFSFNTATQPLSFFAPFWVNYKHISIIIIRNI